MPSVTKWRRGVLVSRRNSHQTPTRPATSSRKPLVKNVPACASWSRIQGAPAMQPTAQKRQQRPLAKQKPADGAAAPSDREQQANLLGAAVEVKAEQQGDQHQRCGDDEDAETQEQQAEIEPLLAGLQRALPYIIKDEA